MTAQVAPNGAMGGQAGQWTLCLIVGDGRHEVVQGVAIALVHHLIGRVSDRLNWLL
jgi:hypothetical protein